MSPEISVIIVAYRTRELILRLLTTLAAAGGEVSYEVIVVDNACPEDSATAVAGHFPEVRLLRLGRNVGFGRAVNAGTALARGGWLLLLNPDTEPVGDLLGELRAATRADPGQLIYAGRTLGPDGADDGRSVFGLPSLWSCLCFATGLSSAVRGSRWANPEELPRLDRTRPSLVPAASGCVLLIRRTLFDTLGGFDPTYFMYGEDADLCDRASRLGARPILVPGARVVHLNGAASTSVDKRLMLMRGKVTYLRRRWSPWLARLGCWLLATGIAARAAGARLTGRAGYWAEVWAQRASWLPGWPPEHDQPPLTVVGTGAGHDTPPADLAARTGTGTGTGTDDQASRSP